jgi:hypothetical protein
MLRQSTQAISPDIKLQQQAMALPDEVLANVPHLGSISLQADAQATFARV